MWRSRQLCSLIALILVALCTAQESDDPCSLDSSQTSCDSCISASHLCLWCPYLPGNFSSESEPRCRNYSCPEESAAPENPQSQVNTLRDEPLSIESSQDAIQVSPQSVSFSLRRGDTASFNMTFRSLRNSPLDVYFLLDISSSQFMVLETLQNDLFFVANTLRDVSSDFQMGFGAFVDKPTLPFALDSYLINNTNPNDPRGLGPVCQLREVCVPTYSFRSFQELSSDIEAIGANINNSQLSSNIDSAEGALEALLQAAICSEEINWRPNALHIVFLITDQTYKIAGDGRLAGIVTPNDGLCHLEDVIDEDGVQFLEYNFSLRQDYPSLHQVRTALERNVIVPVFAIRLTGSNADGGRIVPAYARLSRELASTGATVVTFGDSSREEILAAIRAAYNQTVQTVQVNQVEFPGYTLTSEPIDGCVNRTESGGCNVQFDEDVTFRISVTLDDCSVARREMITLTGPPFTFSTVELIPICECECSSQDPVVASEFCNSRGDLQCGICDCSVNGTTYYGEQCECDMPIGDCPVDDNGLMCSGNGACDSCQICQCTARDTTGQLYFGEACQCDSTSCPGGCGNGECDCSDASIPVTPCNCSIAERSGRPFTDASPTQPCVCNPDNCYNENFPDELCHSDRDGDGTEFCGCFGCICATGFRSTSDNICILQEQLCPENELCTRCRIGDELTETGGMRNCTGCNASRIEQLTSSTQIPEDNVIESCEYVFEGCVYTLYIQQIQGRQRLSFFRECGTTTLPAIIAGALVGAILLLGILFLIILKLCLVFCDRIEYRKFTHELKEADFAPHENPLYLTPQQDYVNPIRRRTSKRSASTSEQQQQQQQQQQQ